MRRNMQGQETQDSLRTAWSLNVVRHHPALRAQPLRPPLRDRRRLRQAQRGRNLLVTHALGCHFSMVKSEEGIMIVVRMPANTFVFKQLRLWCMDVVSCGWWCVAVNCANICCFCHRFSDGGIFHQTWPNIVDVHDVMVLGPPFSIRPFSSKNLCSMPKTQGLREAQNAKGPFSAGHPVQRNL